MNMFTPYIYICFVGFSLFFCLFLEANPEKFNSRFRNKMFYAGVSAAKCINVVMLYGSCFTDCFLFRSFCSDILRQPVLHSDALIEIS